LTKLFLDEPSFAFNFAIGYTKFYPGKKDHYPDLIGEESPDSSMQGNGRKLPASDSQCLGIYLDSIEVNLTKRYLEQGMN